MWGWFMLWILVRIVKPTRKDQKGYTWRLLKKLSPWSLIKVDNSDALGSIFRRTFRWLIMYIFVALLTALVFDGHMEEITRYMILILIELDDYVNGDDDDRKRRWDWVKNKIKWKMELPQPVPAGSKIGS